MRYVKTHVHERLTSVLGPIGISEIVYGFRSVRKRKVLTEKIKELAAQ
jgi:hypothetical protein